MGIGNDCGDYDIGLYEPCSIVGVSDFIAHRRIEVNDNLRSIILVAFVLCIYTYGQFVGRRDAPTANNHVGFRW